MPTPQPTNSSTPQLEAALRYLRRGYAPIDLPYRSKNPDRIGWQNERHGPDQLRGRFSSNGQLHGVGILVGEPSGGLIDIDLDAPEALALADVFLPSTNSVFGRPGKPRSHREYVISPVLPTRKFRDPVLPLGSKDDEEHARMLIEFRSSGAQTVFPPSIHEGGEPIVWVEDGEPLVIDGYELLGCVFKLAAAALLTRYWPRPGSRVRHDCALALAGALYRHNWDREQVVEFVSAVIRAAGDEEARDRVTAAITTAAQLDKGGAATGLPRLREILGPTVVDRLAEWLHLQPGSMASASDADQPPVWRPTVLLSPEESEAAAKDTFIDRYIAYATKRTDAPAEFHEALSLSVLSVVVGRRAVLRLAHGDAYPILWVLILADSTLFRKSTAMDIARDQLEQLDRELLTPNDFTPQRFVAILAEHDGRPLLFVRDEFSGFYDGLNRLDFMTGLKEALMNVYDGRPFRREKMRPKGTKDSPTKDDDWKFDVRAPFLSMAVATTEERFADVARVNDVHSGFLARFGIVLPGKDLPERKPVRAIDHLVEELRAKLVAELAAMVKLDSIQLSCSEEAFARFNQYVTDLESEAERAPDRNLVALVGARISWMGMHIAMLLAVADTTQRVTLPHLLRAILITEAWRHNALKVLGSLAPSKFERRIARVVQRVERAGERGLSRRDAMRAIRASKREMDDIEATVRERGDFKVHTVATSGGPSIHYYPNVVTHVTPVT